MGADPRKRQKKLEKKSAKRKEKKHELVRAQSVGMAERMRAASDWPVLACWISHTLEDQGMGWVHFSRVSPSDQVAVAVFLVDRYCLGVKNAIAQVLSRWDYDNRFVREGPSLRDYRQVDPADARKLVEQAVAYARDLGLPPHADYFKAAPLFGSVDPTQSTAVFEFGKDGKPLFINGPHDTPDRCRRILNLLEKHCGPGGYHTVLLASDGSRHPLLGGPEDLDWDEDEAY